MCTLIVLHRCVPGTPLVVAANRDEFLDRPAEGPALRMRSAGSIVSPLDLEAGGTWLGLNEHGVFAGLTNLRPTLDRIRSDRVQSDLPQGHPQQGPILAAAKATRAMSEQTNASPEALLASGPLGKVGARSRGEVVMAALEARSASEAATAIARLEEDAYNPFQLLVADSREAWLSVYRDRPDTRLLEPGVHVVGNVEEQRFGTVLGSARSGAVETFHGEGDAEHERQYAEAPRVKKLRRIRERVEKLLTESSRDLLEELAGVCREHVDPDPFESTCVHVADRYGTRSSLLLELANRPSASRLWATDGPPCERSFEDLTTLLRQLDARSTSQARG
jgi:uncharacterized protein with NRDE domain